MTTPALGPKVSACIVAYNQEKLIEKTLQSLLDQETDFPFEILVGDDASTDGTWDVIAGIADRHPGRVKGIRQEVNVGPTRNYLAVHQQARGEYIAHFDGDDWALPGKLQAQADALDANPDCTVTWHRVFTETEDGQRFAPSRPPMTVFGPGGKITLGLLLQAGSMTINSSMMYRRSAMNYDFEGREVLDYYAAISLVAKGYGVFLDQRLGVYCCSSNGMTRTARAKVQGRLQDHLRLFLEIYPKFAPEIFSLAVATTVKGLIRPGDNPIDWKLLRNSFSLLGLARVPRAFWLGWYLRGPMLTND